MFGKYFKANEFTCRCGCGKVEMSVDFLNRVNALRECFDLPFIVTSGYRCPEYNMKVSSTGRTGPHTTGRAVDIALDRARVFAVLARVHEFGFTGIGLNQKGVARFIHLDDLPNGPHPRPNVWTY